METVQVRPMNKPIHRSFLFWGPVAAIVLLAALAIHSFFFSVNLRIPRDGAKAPGFLYLEGGVIHLDWEATPAPYAERTFLLLRSRLKDRPSPFSPAHLFPTFFNKESSYKYEGATMADRKAAHLAGIRTPKVEYHLALPVWMIITVIAGLWFWIYWRRARRLAKEEWELARKEAAAS